MTEWLLKKFSELTLEELYTILKVRQQVFIVEQGIEYVDCDDKDQNALHFMGWQQNEHGKQLIAYSRVLPPGKKYSEVCFGRVLTTKNVRSLGLGKELIAELIKKIHEAYPNQAIRISAQEYLSDFYQQFGFDPVGKPYIEEDILHIEMLRQTA